MIYKKQQSGFSVLFASLIGSLVLSIGIAILSITLKQISLASSSRESQRAFYAADSGTEFALYLDRGAGFGEECPDGVFPIPGKSSVICKVTESPISYEDIVLNDTGGGFGETDAIKISESDPNSYTTEISVKRTSFLNNPICFDLFVTKTSTDSGVTVKTRIESRGYSTCNEAASNRFERAILTTY